MPVRLTIIGPVPLPLLLERAASVRPLLLILLVSLSLNISLSVLYKLAEEEYKVASGWLMLYRAGI